MSDFIKKDKNQLKMEFIKSGAMLLLALVLLVSVALAWFEGGGDDDKQPVVDFSVGLVSPDISDIELGNDVVKERNIILPCATKLGDPEIDVEDFKNAVTVDIYTIRAASNVEVQVIVEPPTDDESSEASTAPMPHYFVYCDYNDSLSEGELAQMAFNNHSQEDNLNDKPAVFVMPKDVDKKVAIVYWGDYDEAFEAEVNGTSGKFVYKAKVHFRALNEENDEEGT